MLARLLRYNIDILQHSKTVSEYGTVEFEYTLYYSTRAGIKYEGGGEQSENDRRVVNESLTFQIRERKDKTIYESYRIRYNNQKYDIKEIIPKFDGVFKSLEIKAEKVNE